jgi:hypothetical protein
VYTKSWFTAPSAIKVPNQDLQLLKKTVNYAAIDPNISRVVLNKLKDHLWYSSSEDIGLTSLITCHWIKKNMMSAMKKL